MKYCIIRKALYFLFCFVMDVFPDGGTGPAGVADYDRLVVHLQLVLHKRQPDRLPGRQRGLQQKYFAKRQSCIDIRIEFPDHQVCLSRFAVKIISGSFSYSYPIVKLASKIILLISNGQISLQNYLSGNF